MMISIAELLKLHFHYIRQWYEGVLEINDTDFLALVAENHRFNFQLWLEEDKARRDDKGFEFVYHAKRNIDRFNQQRNNFMEKMDQWVFAELKPIQDGSVPFNSESPGMMIDRLSILALKEYHMGLQVERKDVDEAHRETCAKKLAVLQQQRQDLGQRLEELLHQIKNRTRSFKVYYQFKMYNDPSLNPQLYKK